VRAAYQYNVLLKSARLPQGREKDCAPHRSLNVSRPILRKKDISEPFNVLITGGGTGGHLFPGIAIAESFMERNPDNRILFVSIGNQFEKNILSEKKYNFATVTASGIKGKTVWQKLKSISLIPVGILEALKIIKHFKPDLAIGMGSYSSGPVLLAAWLSGIKIVLHEQNIKPGITNRFLSGLAERVYVSFRHTNTGIIKSKIRFTGNPVRKNILEYSKIQDGTNEIERISKINYKHKFTVLVLGGSQGAHSINMAVIEALTCLNSPKNFLFIHQTGPQDERIVRDTYMRLGIDCVVKSFFDDMGSIYRKANLIVCRAGATTVAEVTAIGKCPIFIPYPYAADDHQTFNAKSVADANAAEIVLEADLSEKTLAGKIEALASDPIRLKTIAENSKSIGNPDAAANIINDCYQLLLKTGPKKEHLYK